MNSKKIRITIYPSGRSALLSPGTPLRYAFDILGKGITMPCGGKGRCAKCLVYFQEGAPPPTPADEAGLTESELAQGYRLACQVILDRDAVIFTRDHKFKATDKILVTGATRDFVLKPNITKRYAVIPKPTVDDLRSDLDRILDVFDIKTGFAPSLQLLKNLGCELRKSGFKATGVFANGKLISVEGGEATQECYGIAFDIGTTTIAGYLLDLTNGSQLAVTAAVNPQARIGEDVISRISYSMQEPKGLKWLQTAVVKELNRIAGRLARQANVSLSKIYEAVVVGNTCMTHLLLGVDPRHLAQAPYVPTFSHSMTLDAGDLGLRINSAGLVHVLPNVAGYVGADTVGMILATAIHKSDGIVLAVDIGTNGEIVLGSKERMLACSTAAGPAFEGAHIKHGMRAASGAIDSVWITDGDIEFSTVDGAKAVGICGSGLLDAIVCLRKAGILEESGRIVDVDEVPPDYGGLKARLTDGGFVLASAEHSAHGTPVVITQRDVREVQLAKGAIAAGIRTLMERLNIVPNDLSAVVLAGAFGNYMRKQSAIAAGLIPNVPLSKVHSVGNAAGEGAKLALLSTDERSEADRIAQSIEYVELTTDSSFQEKFAEALMFGPWPDTGSQSVFLDGVG
ncbi:MAG: ASKHA domain-containing protein [Armatimonadota bacterium]|nr:ASKHA domain-containing protein [Armatimonadota bacterium]